MKKQIMISTIDNPFNPFENFENWFLFDCEKGYYTCSKLARLSNITEEMSETEQIEACEAAIDRLIELDPFDIYIKVEKNE